MSSGNHKEYDPEPGLEGRKDHEASELVALLSGSQLIADGHHRIDEGPSGASTPPYGLKHLLASFVGGIAACLALQLSLFGPDCYSFRGRTGGSGAGTSDQVDVYAPPWVGSTIVHNYPPASPTNDFPELFPTKYALAPLTSLPF
jgi:hypothetical protein